MRTFTAGIIASACVVSAATQADVLVDLNVADADFDSATDNDAIGSGFNTSSVNASAGLTFNITFAPAAGDLDSTTTGVNLMEIGGEANGTGLYLLGGEIYFLSKMNGSSGDFVASFNDLDVNSGNDMIGIKSTFGQLTAGTSYSIAVVFDPLATSPSVSIAVKEGAGAVVTESYNLAATAKTNWAGDKAASAFENPSGMGGASNNSGTPFRTIPVQANIFEGTQGQALYWNDLGTLVPEPGSLALLGLGGLCVLRRRRG